MIEKDCVFEFQGQKFESGGAVVADNYLAAYPAENNVLNDWRGNKIGTYSVISSRPAIFFGRHSWQGSRYYYMRALVGGKSYSLRGFGVGMLARGRKIKGS